jgi:transposase
MERFIGIDVHSQSCTVTVVGPSGKKLSSRVVETNGAMLVEAIKAIPGDRHICFEEGTQSAWLYELLEKYAKEIVVCVPPAKDGSKSDEMDAADLANQLRLGTIKRRVFKAPRAFSALRQATRIYSTLAVDVARTKNRLRALFRERGLTVSGAQLYDTETRPAAIEQLPAAQCAVAKLLGEELDGLEELKLRAEEALELEARKHPIVARLATAPGIGLIRAAQIATIVVTPHRFRTTRQFWSYCGLGIVTHSSADWIKQDGHWVRASVRKTRGLNRNRHPVLKQVFKGAAQHVVSHMKDNPLHADYERMLAANIKPNLAALTLARRIAAAVLAMWRNQEDYAAERQTTRH